MKDGRITIFGASGYTGRLMIAEAMHLGLPIRLAGRRAQRLAEVRAEAGVDAEIVVADIHDAASLERMTADCEVLVNCSGPYTEYGEPVVASAVRAGAHYIDVTGDQGFTERIYRLYGEEARERGVAIVCALGFESTLGDLAAALLHQAPDAPQRFDRVLVGYALDNLQVSEGTRLSLGRIGSQGSYVYEQGALREALACELSESFRFPEPVGTRKAYFIPLPEVVFIPQHVPTDFVATYMVLPDAFAAQLREKARHVQEVPFTAPPPQQGHPAGPDDAGRRANTFALCVTAFADGQARQVHFTGTDMYGWACIAAMHGAALMLAPDYDRRGALAPSLAYDAPAFLDYLRSRGMSLLGPYTL